MAQPTNGSAQMVQHQWLSPSRGCTGAQMHGSCDRERFRSPAWRSVAPPPDPQSLIIP